MGPSLYRVPGEAGKGSALTHRSKQKARLAFSPRLPSISDCQPLLREIADSLFSVAFPGTCSICNAEVINANGLGVCRDCWSKVEPWEGICCERCGLPIISERAAESAQVLCGACRAGDHSFDLGRVFGIYRGSLRQLILQLKFRRRERLGTKLGSFLTRPLERLAVLAEVRSPLIVPVPLFQSRERERGFNQARLLAEGLIHQVAKSPGRTKLKVETRLLIRTRQTKPQAGLRFKARKENVKGAFAIAKPESLRGKRVILVDDVMTTGATLSACASALKKEGASKVFALALARATPQFPDFETLPEAPGVDEIGHNWT